MRPHIENKRFWELSTHQLRYIIADCNAAITANPNNPKCTHGPGNYADQINDCCTIINWKINNENTSGC